jgi:hypothetical protein
LRRNHASTTIGFAAFSLGLLRSSRLSTRFKLGDGAGTALPSHTGSREYITSAPHTTPTKNQEPARRRLGRSSIRASTRDYLGSPAQGSCGDDDGMSLGRPALLLGSRAVTSAAPGHGLCGSGGFCHFRHHPRPRWRSWERGLGDAVPVRRSWGGSPPLVAGWNQPAAGFWPCPAVTKPPSSRTAFGVRDVLAESAA